MRFLSWSMALVPLAVSVACGGATPTDLFAAPSGEDAGVDSARVVVDSGSGMPSFPDVTTSVPLDSAPPPDTAPPPMTNPDTGAGGSQTFPCGEGQPGCPVGPEEVCCVTGMFPSLNFACSDQNMCMQQGGAPISCSSPAQCAGETCCGTETGTGTNTHYVDVQCQPSCNGVELCDPMAPSCRTGTTCQPSMLLAGYYVCR